MKRYKKILSVLAVFTIFLSALTFGQESPFIPEKTARDLNNELSGDKAFDYIRWLSHYHRIMGSKRFLDAAKRIAKFAREFGLENIQIVEQPFEGRPSWDVISGELWVIEPGEIKIADFSDVPVFLAVFSRSARLTAELVDIGEGRTEKDFDGKDVTGKVVLTSSSPGLAMRTAVWERGAEGVLSSASIREDPDLNTPDQIAYMKVPVQSRDGKPSTWAFMISPRQRRDLQKIISKAERQNQKVKVKVDIEVEFRKPARQAYAWAEIRGSEIHDQDIVLTAHLDEEKTSANDNGSGCASQLEIARAINHLIQNGKISRPKRDIVFWWPNEHTSEYQYFRAHPEERKNMLININQDMVGAKQSMGSRVQHITRTPASIPSYLSDVIESIVEYVVLSNNAYLAVRDAGGPYPFSKPILSYLGTREQYHAKVVPYSAASDHEVFCEGIIGVPGVGLINYPDPYIHSSADDLDNIDPTQLKRNAFIVAAATLFVANSGDEDVPLIASEVYARALQRLGRDLGTSVRHIFHNKAGSMDRSYKEARNLIQQAIIRELRALSSVLVFALPEGKNEKFVIEKIKEIQGKEKDLLKDIDEAFVIASGGKIVPKLNLSEEEKEMAKKIPVNIDSLDEYFKKRGYFVNAPGLHPEMAKECYCFVDGKNSYLNIFNAVHAEAMAVGSFYYGNVKLKDVRALLDDAVEKGILKLT